MGQVSWSEQAASDLENIHRFIAHDSLAAADVTIERIRESARRLEEFPLMGRQLPEDPDSGDRELIIPPFRLMYSVVGDEVRIFTVHHSARDVRPDNTEG